MNYKDSWAPADEDQAQYLIDTTREGETFWNEGARLADWVMRFAPKNASTVMEYGCGIGRIIGRTGAPNPIGIDVSPQMLAFAREKFPKVAFLECNGNSIPLTAGRVDLAYSVLVLQHLDAADADAVVHDIARVLRVGGRALLSFSGFGRPWSEGQTVDQGKLHWEGKRNGSFCPAHGCIAYTEEIVRTLASAAALKVLDVQHEVTDSYHHNYVLLAEK